MRVNTQESSLGCILSLLPNEIRQRHVRNYKKQLGREMGTEGMSGKAFK